MDGMSLGKRRILIADDHALFRAGVRALLEAHTDWEVGGEAATGDEALQRMRDEEWDAVLLDISMPDRTGIDILRQIRSHKPDLPILILSMYPEEQYAVNLLRAGATGYLTKDAVPELVVTALRTLLAGRKYISDEVAQLLAKDLDGDGRPLHSRLSEREFQIFCKLAGGMTVGDIASELHLSNKTISTYRARVLEKMNLATNADLTYYAIKNGLIQ
jgi:DNA-binding NarL/FixJ family response regulator